MLGKYDKIIKIIAVAAVVIIFLWALTPVYRRSVNEYFNEIHKADDASRYATRKHVEDSCRSMVASYTGDKLTYEQYKESDNPEKQSWAEQARMRANKTAAIYNEYVLKNSYVWDGNIPSDIRSELPYI